MSAAETVASEDAAEVLAASAQSPEDAASDAPRPNPFRGCAIWPDASWFNSAPPPRRWLLRRPDDHGGTAGFLPLGKVGILAGGGGSGKTMVLIQLGLSIATGRDWLDTFSVPEESMGRVLLALGEEDPEEVHRRVHSTFNAMWPSDTAEHRRKRAAAIKVVAKRLVIVPLAAELVSLVSVDPHSGETQPSEHLNQLVGELADHGGEPWRLVVLDPLSRFAGPNTEMDNASGTRFVQAVERIAAEAHGKPTVLLAHHTTKSSRNGGTPTDATSVRGSSALTDGVRWVMTMRPNEPPDKDPTEGLVDLKLAKSNYGPPDQVRTVMRIEGGVLIPAPTEERRIEARFGPDHLSCGA